VGWIAFTNKGISSHSAKGRGHENIIQMAIANAGVGQEFKQRFAMQAKSRPGGVDGA
jgi:hypothetical protein